MEFNEELLAVVVVSLLASFPFTLFVVRYVIPGTIDVDTIYQALKSDPIIKVADVYSRVHKQAVPQLSNKKLTVVYISKQNKEYEELNIKLRGKRGILIAVFKEGKLDQLGLYPNLEIEPVVDRQTSIRLYLLLSEVRRVADK
jgi:hypothetical protein